MGSRIAYRKLQAPRRHGAALVDPAFRDVTDMLRRNLARRQSWARTDRGRLIAENRTAAREHLLRLATRLTRQYRDLERRTAPDPAAPIILAGHQPLLFHPGVWFKNFALDRLARRCDATAVHLSIDNDAPRTASIQVPTGSVTRPAAVAVAFDRAADARVPFEQGTIRDRSLFHSFGRRAEKTIAPLVSDPLLHEFWPMAIEAAGRTDNPGACLAQARHRLEERAGMATLEVPMSRVCDGDVFFRFVGWLLSDLPRLQAVFNDSLAEYRAVHRLRSRSHPVPDLARDGDWLEAPFWIWSDDRPQRRRLFARRIGRAVEITDRAGTCRQIDLPARTRSIGDFDGPADAPCEEPAALRTVVGPDPKRRLEPIAVACQIGHRVRPASESMDRTILGQRVVEHSLQPRQVGEQPADEPKEHISVAYPAHRHFQCGHSGAFFEPMPRLSQARSRIVRPPGRFDRHRPKLVQQWVGNQRCDGFFGPPSERVEQTAVANRALLEGHASVGRSVERNGDRRRPRDRTGRHLDRSRPRCVVVDRQVYGRRVAPARQPVECEILEPDARMEQQRLMSGKDDRGGRIGRRPTFQIAVLPGQTRCQPQQVLSGRSAVLGDQPASIGSRPRLPACQVASQHVRNVAEGGVDQRRAVPARRLEFAVRDPTAHGRYPTPS